MAYRILICILAVFLAHSVSSDNRDQKLKNLIPFMGVNPNELLRNTLRQGSEASPTADATTTEETQKSCVCSKIYDPVCASNEKSYFNLCLMECDIGQQGNVTVVHQGNCIPF